MSEFQQDGLDGQHRGPAQKSQSQQQGNFTSLFAFSVVFSIFASGKTIHRGWRCTAVLCSGGVE